MSRSPRGKMIGYWVTTVPVALVLFSGGLFQVIQQHDAIAAITGLGYPLHFVIILGVWKMLGGVTLLAPRTPRLKEWAYAGAIFDFTGAAFSQGVSHTGVGHIIWPLSLAALTMASWALRPESRVIGNLFPKVT